MGTLSVIAGGLSLLAAFLIAVTIGMLWMLLEEPALSEGASGLPPADDTYLSILALISLVTGAWLLAAGIAALQQRRVTVPLHLSAAVFRIAAYLLFATSHWWIGWLGVSQGMPTPSHQPPLKFVAVSVLELIYPVVILVVFTQRRRREYLRAVRSWQAT